GGRVDLLDGDGTTGAGGRGAAERDRHDRAGGGERVGEALLVEAPATDLVEQLGGRGGRAHARRRRHGDGEAADRAGEVGEVAAVALDGDGDGLRGGEAGDGAVERAEGDVLGGQAVRLGHRPHPLPRGVVDVDGHVAEGGPGGRAQRGPPDERQ